MTNFTFRDPVGPVAAPHTGADRPAPRLLARAVATCAMLALGASWHAASAQTQPEAAINPAAVAAQAHSTSAGSADCATGAGRATPALNAAALAGRPSDLGGRVVRIAAGVRNAAWFDAAAGRWTQASWPRTGLVDSATPRVSVRLDAGDVLDPRSLHAPGGRIDVHAGAVNQRGVVRADAMRVGPSGEMVLTAGDAADRPLGAQAPDVGRCALAALSPR